ncbi:serine hydrolase domain-containing protein [uncultured Aquimarina sp.]|uniref:serine hydrolase domain-containing protein n=1 Tax=uncultured Aquimarina sp. TaxID=575652 RepID=UPI00262DE130|nr:serine hydrolase domain-containing protein [uncultured Aquimarina sp.]
MKSNSIKLKTTSLVLIAIVTLFTTPLISQTNSYSVELLETKLDSVIQSSMESRHVPGLAFIIVKDGKTLLKKGYGYTSLGDNIKQVDPDSTIFRIGSITKTFTALALLQLADDKKIDLDKDVNIYLKSVKVPNTFKKPVTTTHLLNHSAGFDELRGRVVYDKEEQIPLNQFLKDKLVRLREPGIVSSYSTFGIALAGLLVEDISGMSLEAYMQENIWNPLNMDMTCITLNEKNEDYASIGYEYRDGINLPMPWEFYHTYPASEINSTVTDMGKYIQMYLNLGKYKGKQVLSKKNALAMQRPQLAIHPEIESFCYGFYEEYAEDLRTVSHGGDMLGFSGYMALVPDKNMGIYVVNHHEGSRIRYTVLNAILQFFNPNPKEKFKYTRLKNDLSKFAGTYMWSTYCHTCENAWKPNPEQIKVNNDYTITVFGEKFHQVESLLFKNESGRRTLGFLENNKGKITHMAFGASNMFERID